MFLTRIEVNPTGFYAEAMLTPYRAHGIMNAIFPDEPRLLYRVEHNIYANQLTVLAQSQNRPAAEWLMENKNFARDLRTKVYDPQFVAGERLMFRLLAQPVRRFESRVVSVPETGPELMDWLRERQRGFEIVQASPVEVRSTKITKPNHNYLLKMVMFDGQLQVTDAAEMRKAMESGIGRSKYLGCGLLSLSR